MPLTVDITSIASYNAGKRLSFAIDNKTHKNAICIFSLYPYLYGINTDKCMMGLLFAKIPTYSIAVDIDRKVMEMQDNLEFIILNMDKTSPNTCFYFTENIKQSEKTEDKEHYLIYEDDGYAPLTGCVNPETGEMRIALMWVNKEQRVRATKPIANYCIPPFSNIQISLDFIEL